MVKKNKYDDVIRGEVREYFYKEYIIGLPIKKGSLKIRIAWDDKKLFIRNAKFHNGEEFIDIPEIIHVDNKMIMYQDFIK